MGTVIADHADSVVALTDAATISLDASRGKIYTVTLGGNRTLANPTNLRKGMEFWVKITQDGTGSRTLALGSLYICPGGTNTLTSTAAGIDVLHCIYDGTHILTQYSLAYAA
jgi:hypothetical protein